MKGTSYGLTTERVFISKPENMGTKLRLKTPHHHYSDHQVKQGFRGSRFKTTSVIHFVEAIVTQPLLFPPPVTKFFKSRYTNHQRHAAATFIKFHTKKKSFSKNLIPSFITSN